MEEIWKDIKGYEGAYKISCTGKIMSIARTISTSYHDRKHVTNDRMLKQTITRHGYAIVSLNKNGQKTRYCVHRLVAEAFIPNPDNLPQVNHKDECKLNNCSNNLEWCTAQYNVNYSGTIQNAINARKRKVLQFEKTGEFIKEFESVTSASKETKTCQSAITLACQGKYKTAGGYIWKYYEEN